MSDSKPLERWRLILGDSGSAELGACGERTLARDAALDWLYGREGRGGAAGDGAGGAGSGGSTLSVPEWINEVHELFPSEVVERIEKDAVERYGIDEIVTNPEVLERVEPNEALLAAVLRTKHLMNPDVLSHARRIVRVVVERLLDALQSEVRRAITGPIDRRKRSAVRDARNFDFRTTLRRNLKNYDAATGRVLIENAHFFSRTQRHLRRWQVILLVDQSGSMVESTIHSAVSAACLWGLPGLKTHLCAFDTEVVDLTKDVDDPVELLMKVQLGGGTHIDKALEYGSQLIENPRNAIVVLITDLFEGGQPGRLIQLARALCEQGSRLLVLGALDRSGVPQFDRAMATRLANEGATVGAMTPFELVKFVSEAMRA